jgi:hypothetical protein
MCNSTSQLNRDLPASALTFIVGTEFATDELHFEIGH